MKTLSCSDIEFKESKKNFENNSPDPLGDLEIDEEKEGLITLLNCETDKYFTVRFP